VKLGPGILHAPDEDPDAVAEELRSEGWRVYVVPDDIDDAAAFAAVAATLPLDPPWKEGFRLVWDALSDFSLRRTTRIRRPSYCDRLAALGDDVQGDYAGFMTSARPATTIKPRMKFSRRSPSSSGIR
jgi:hypothetical protein